jgi:hypothetical protein
LKQAVSRFETELQKHEREFFFFFVEHSPQFQQLERDIGRDLDFADLLLDAIGTGRRGLDYIALVLHFLKYLLLQILFRSFSIFPGTVRPRCTTMPWTIWPALVVLWGVCWMFYYPRPDMQSEHGRTPHSEIGNSQQSEYGISYVSMCQISRRLELSRWLLQYRQLSKSVTISAALNLWDVLKFARFFSPF